ncbi:MAG: DUF1648 domain-containing protein [Agriterribacter sp.]
MENRPIIKLHLSSFDRCIEYAGWMLLLFLWIFTMYAWFHLPASIPTHFNVTGAADNHGGKETMLLLPVIGTFVFALITLLNKYPQIFNYMVKITIDNAKTQYTIATRMMRLLKLSVLIIFSIILVYTFLIGTGKASGLGKWFLPFTLAITILPTVYMVVKSFRSR